MATAGGTIPAFNSSAVRPGPVGLISEAVGELWSRRQLVRYLVQADLKKKGADSLLGNLWWVLDPLLQMLVYVVLVSVIFQRSQEAYPLFIFAAILPWKWFSSSISDGTMSVTSQERLIKQLQFPKIVLPSAVAMSEVVNFAFGLIPLLGLLIIFYSDRLTIYLVFIPAIAAVQFVFTLACTIGVAATNVFFRDVGNVSRHLLRLWFYLSPGLYSLSALEGSNLPHAVKVLLEINPFAILFEAYRAVIYGTADSPPTMPDWTMLAGLLVVSVGLLGLAMIYFKRVEPSFAKVL
jgi:ABC-type polysaccharide/polyol phosphate export permease